MRHLYEELIQAVTDPPPDFPERQLSGFAARRGKEATGQLMVVGRSVNGWGECWDVASLRLPSKRSEFLNEMLSLGPGHGEGCPLDWVVQSWGAHPDKRYNAKRSAFWRVTRSILLAMGIVDAETTSWPSSLIWSNLYKVSPAEGGNPSTRLQGRQFDVARRILQEEVRVHQPDRVLFLTGNTWAHPFLEMITRDEGRPSGREFVERVGYLDFRSASGGRVDVPFVVAGHPQGKKEEPFIREVVDSYQWRTSYS